ncbi:MAG: glycosyl hydrolase [Acidobacteria bacterium]|nr:MAG: glycosyl hydrolase [Acidobacteriota bacterium]
MVWAKRLSAIAVIAGAGMLALGAVQAGGGTSSTPAQELMSKLQWRSVGPYVGGRAVTVTGVPQDPSLFYMGTVGGGVWKSNNNGISWANISDGKLPGTSASIGAIAVAPSDPKILYAGTGECDIRNDMIPGDGIYKSADGGKTWKYAGLRAAHTTCAIRIDPRNPEIAYAASMGQVFAPNGEGGVYKTSDGGQTWTKILAGGNGTSGAIDVVMAPGNPNELYASMWQAQRMPWGMSDGGAGSGLYKSTDGGATWTNLTRNPGLPAGTDGRIGVALTAAAPQRVYAIVENKADGGVFRSDDGGATWTREFHGWELRQRAFYYTALYADPKNPDLVYAPEVEFYVSRDGGKTFKRMRVPHGDNHIIWINPEHTNILLEGNDGGATVSLDGGKTWSSEHNQPTGEMYHVNIDDEFPFHIYGAQQDEGSAEAPSATADGSIPLSAWKSISGGESTRVVPEPGSPWINFGSGYYELFTATNRRTGETWDVTPAAVMHDGLAANTMKYRLGWTHAITFSPVNPKQLLIGAQYVLESMDYGRTWKRISPDLTRNDPATEVPSGGPVTLDQTGAETYPGLQTIEVSPLNGQEIWTGSDDGLAHLTRDGGKTWQDVTPPQLPKQSWISCIEPSYVNAGTAYLTARRYMWNDFRPYVFKTSDYGQTWTPMIDGLPDNDYVFNLRQDPAAPNLLFLTTSTTVEVSLNGGTLWQPLKLNLPTVQVRDLRIARQQGQVAIATHGRAFWVLDDLALLEQMSRQTPPATGAYLFAPQQAWLSPVYGGGRFGGGTAGANPPFGTTVYFRVPQHYDGSTPATLTFTNAKGQTIRQFALHLKTKAQPNRQEMAKLMASMTPEQREAFRLQRLTAITPGMNRFQWDMRYPAAATIGGGFIRAEGVGVEYSMAGPVVVPGSYSVTLNYAGQKLTQPFTVTLDPRLPATQADLAAQLDLELQIHGTLNQLDEQVNRALALRTKLEKDPGRDNSTAINGLTSAIVPLVQMEERGSETDAVFGTRLHLHLAILSGEIAEGYRRPTPAEYAAYRELAGKIAGAEQTLSAAMKTAGAVVAAAN